MPDELSLGSLREEDVPHADRVMREAFAARVGAAPDEVFRDASMVVPRFRIHPDGAVVARLEDGVAGSALAMRWGRVGVFGPLSVRPDRWGGVSVARCSRPRSSAWRTGSSTTRGCSPGATAPLTSRSIVRPGSGRVSSRS